MNDDGTLQNEVNKPMRVIDVSHWQIPTQMDWVTAREQGNVVGVICKVTQGMESHDPAAQQHLFDSYSGGITLNGVYHFGTRADDPSNQAAFFINSADQMFQSGNLDNILLMLDLEGNANDTMSVEQAATFVETVYTLVGRYPVLYMGHFGPGGNGDGLPNASLSKCDLMEPEYGNHIILPPGFRYPVDDNDRRGVVRLHQFSDGTVNGFAFPGLGKVDQSEIIGFDTEAKLAKWWGQK